MASPQAYLAQRQHHVYDATGAFDEDNEVYYQHKAVRKFAGTIYSGLRVSKVVQYDVLTPQASSVGVSKLAQYVALETPASSVAVSKLAQYVALETPASSVGVSKLAQYVALETPASSVAVSKLVQYVILQGVNSSTSDKLRRTSYNFNPEDDPSESLPWRVTRRFSPAPPAVFPIFPTTPRGYRTDVFGDGQDEVWRYSRGVLSTPPALPSIVPLPPRRSRSDLFDDPDVPRARISYASPASGFPANLVTVRRPRADFADEQADFIFRITKINSTAAPQSLRASQLVFEVLSVANPLTRASQLVFEALAITTSTVRVSQFFLEVLVPTKGINLPTMYPTLAVGFSWIKRPNFSNGLETASSGREVRPQYWAYPLWEWDLTYEYLPDYPANGFTDSDLKTLMGFYLATKGTALPFRFKDPDDNYVQGQEVGTTDGATTVYTLFRSYGLGDFEGTEPVGFVDDTVQVNVYLDGVLQDPSTWSILSGTAGNQQLKFSSAPASGHVITIDMGFLYSARIKDDTQDFEKFLNQLWLVKKITLRSLRGE